MPEFGDLETSRGRSCDALSFEAEVDGVRSAIRMRVSSPVMQRGGRNAANREVPEIGTFKPSRCNFRLTEHPEPLISARIEAQKAFRSKSYWGMR